MYTGPNITPTGLVYGYDTGIGVSTNTITTRLYPGQPTTNVVTNTNLDTGWSKDYQSSIVFNEIEPPVGINSPTVGFNRGNTSGYWYSYGDYAPQDPNVTYTVSMYVKTLDSNFNINYYTADNSETGRVWGPYINVPNNGNWNRIVWPSFQNPSNSQSDSLSFNFSYNGSIGSTSTRTWFCAPQMEAKSNATPFVIGTRSVTQALIDADRITTIDLSNVSFNSSAQPTFDGTDGFIDLPVSALPAMSQMTIELVNFGIDARNSSIIAGGVGGNQDLNIHLPWGDGNIYWDLGRPFNRVWKAAGSDYIGYHHWVFTKNPSTGIMNIYRDGVLWAQNTGQTSSIISLAGGQASIGRYSNGSTNAYYHNGIVPVMRIYNVELTATQVAQNFLGYRRRFGI